MVQSTIVQVEQTKQARFRHGKTKQTGNARELVHEGNQDNLAGCKHASTGTVETNQTIEKTQEAKLKSIRTKHKFQNTNKKCKQRHRSLHTVNISDNRC